MNKNQKTVINHQLKQEEKVLRELKMAYAKAEQDIDEKIKLLEADELTQSKIYQIEYQKALKGQIGSILDNMNANNYTTIHEYLKNCYTDAIIGNAYDLAAQGVPLIIPIDQEAAVNAIQLESKVSGSLYTAMGVDVKELKKNIASEVTRGISKSATYKDIARNISNQMNTGLYNATRIARTEGHRVIQKGTMDAMNVAKSKGADVVKQWDSTLDGDTRPSHRMVDGEIRELDEPFSNGLMYPGDPNGKPGEVIQCRCVLLQRAKWALDEEELDELKKRAEFFGLDKSAAFEDFKKKYLEAVEEEKPQATKPKKIKEKYKELFLRKDKADQYFRKWADKTTYALGDDELQKAIYDYTEGSGPINMPLSGYDGSWDRKKFKGIGKVKWDDDSAAGKTIRNLTEIIDKTEPLNTGVVLVRGSDKDGLLGLFEGAGFDFDELKKELFDDIVKSYKEKTVEKLKGTVVKNHAFTSCGSAMWTGSKGSVQYNIKCPAGTKMVYAEPQSCWGTTIENNGNGKIYKPGMKKDGTSSELEMIIQRGTSYRIDEITMDRGGNVEVTMTVVDQNYND